MVIEPDSEPRFKSSGQTGVLKITLPGDMDQTKDLAYLTAIRASDHISFLNGELKLLGGLVQGEHLPETPEEAEQLGENRHFCIVQFVEAPLPGAFDESSFTQITSNQATRVAMRQYNASLKAENPIDRFLGLFRIIEDIYGPKSKDEALAKVLKESRELLEIARQNLKFVEANGHREFTEADYPRLVEDLVRIRHNCAHLRTFKNFGIPHGDPRVRAEVEPIIGPLDTLAYQAIRKRLGDQESS
jgi:methylamine utilization protein MauJ